MPVPVPLFSHHFWLEPPFFLSFFLSVDEIENPLAPISGRAPWFFFSIFNFFPFLFHHPRRIQVSRFDTNQGPSRGGRRGGRQVLDLKVGLTLKQALLLQLTCSPLPPHPSPTHPRAARFVTMPLVSVGRGFHLAGLESRPVGGVT